MKAPDESGIKKDFPENVTEWIATGGKKCTDDRWMAALENTTVASPSPLPQDPVIYIGEFGFAVSKIAVRFKYYVIV